MSNAELRTTARNDERRTKPRICVPFHATVQGINNDGEKFNVETVVDNMSGDGLYMRMMPVVLKGTSLSIKLVLGALPQANTEASPILVNGVVLRSEKKAGGVCGVAVAFDRVRF